MDFQEEGPLAGMRRRKAGCRKRRILEIGREVAETSKGLFSPDDWQCGKCGNVNWARRYKCNVCREPKYPRVEARTGLAGGYDDRGVVEYVQREDSDGEYDLYGRRRRKRKEEDGQEEEGDEEKLENEEEKDCEEKKEGGEDCKKMEGEDFEKLEQDDLEEEGEEDCEEDGDLTKYDLEDWLDTSVSASRSSEDVRS